MRRRRGQENTPDVRQNSTCLADFDRSRRIRLITQISIDLAARTRSISQNSFNLAGLDRFRRFISLLSVMAHHNQKPRGGKKLVAAKELSSATGAKVNMPQIRDGRVKRCQNDTKLAAFGAPIKTTQDLLCRSQDRIDHHGSLQTLYRSVSQSVIERITEMHQTSIKRSLLAGAILLMTTLSFTRSVPTFGQIGRSKTLKVTRVGLRGFRRNVSSKFSKKNRYTRKATSTRLMTTAILSRLFIAVIGLNTLLHNSRPVSAITWKLKMEKYDLVAQTRPIANVVRLLTPFDAPGYWRSVTCRKCHEQHHQQDRAKS
ncbi:hypothetical protein LSAT2_000212 [Lamellibrachia satsuma]|nr:hypothetical protein LSAT2_000212 [Lamellibrachia satsuma]